MMFEKYSRIMGINWWRCSSKRYSNSITQMIHICILSMIRSIPTVVNKYFRWLTYVTEFYIIFLKRKTACIFTLPCNFLFSYTCSRPDQSIIHILVYVLLHVCMYIVYTDIVPKRSTTLFLRSLTIRLHCVRRSVHVC